MRILLVDDDPGFSKARALVLKISGYDVDTALNRAAAKDLLANNEYDVALLDQNLHGDAGGPVGLDVIADVRAACPWAIIFMVSGYWETQGAVKRAFELGAHDYLIKGEHLGVLLAAKLQRIERDLLDRQRALMTGEHREKALRSTWQQLQTETNAQTKGKLLETLLDHIFRSVPGFRDVRGNVTNTMEEIDLIAAAAHDGPWLHLSPYWLIECKNWSRPVPRKDVARASRSKPPHTSAR